MKERTGFDKDSRIHFTGTVYDKELLKKYERMLMAIFMDMKLEEPIQVC